MPKPLPTTNKRNDGYVGLLFFTALLMSVGILLMYIENDGDYDFNNQVKAAAPQKVSTLLKTKAAPPADGGAVTPPAPAPVPAPAPAPAPPEARAVPAPVVVPPAQPVVAKAPIVPVETAPMATTVDANTPLVKPEAKPPVEPEPPVIRPGFTLPRPPRR
jgi:hypothetical protein